MKADDFNPQWATAEPTTAVAPAVVEWHGGPDAQGVPRRDFSTNANACGPSPALMQALAGADRSHYPDPAYTALRRQLADLHGVVPERIVLAASASEFIHRMTTVVALARPGARVLLPLPGYGDYVRSAIAHDLEPTTSADLWAEAQAASLGGGVGAERASPWRDNVRDEPQEAFLDDEDDDRFDRHADFGDDDGDWDDAFEADDLARGGGPSHRASGAERDPSVGWACESPDWSRVRAPSLVWHTEPGSPMGQAEGLALHWPEAVTVVDRAYAPLQLDGLAHPCPEGVWQLWSPNKALGVTGVRGAYAVAPAAALGCPDAGRPLSAPSVLQRLNALQPSWPLGADGVAMLSCWARPETLAWVHACLDTLRQWKASQLALYAELGWQAHPSTTAFGIVTWPQEAGREMHRVLPALRQLGIKLRDTTSMGLPGWARVSVQSPAAQQELRDAWHAVTGTPKRPAAPLAAPDASAGWPAGAMPATTPTGSAWPVWPTWTGHPPAAFPPVMPPAMHPSAHPSMHPGAAGLPGWGPVVGPAGLDPWGQPQPIAPVYPPR